MKNNKEEKEKEIELFMIAQFIDVIDVLDKYEKIEEIKDDIKNKKRIYLDYIEKMSNSKNFLSLNLYNEDIDKKIENASEIYYTNIEYKDILQKLKIKYENLAKKLSNIDKKELEEIKGLIYEICDFDVHLSYKIGLVDGMKIKNKCT